jgi:carboxypeptidase C (cathepsin A)
MYSSESYGGHYIPTLAKQIVDMNTAGASPKLNFQGFAVGNPYTDTYSGTGAMIDTLWGHQLVSKLDYDAFTAACVTPKVPKVKDCVNSVNTRKQCTSISALISNIL